MSDTLNHPNYVPYDAVKGKPSKLYRPHLRKHAQSKSTVPVSWPRHAPQRWFDRVEAVRLFCHAEGLEFYLSPFDWQIAKIKGAAFTIVLWNSRRKGSKERYIRPAIEGAGEGYGTALASIEKLVRV